MNLSGDAVGSFVRFFKVNPAEDLLVVFDDVSLPVGEIRIRPQGSAGGHNGLSSVIASLGSREFARLRIGILSEDEKRGRELSDYVLKGFSAKADKDLMKTTVDQAAGAALAWLEKDVVFAMNNYNKKRR